MPEEKLTASDLADRLIKLPEISQAETEDDWFALVAEEVKKQAGADISLGVLDKLWWLADCAVAGMGDVFYNPSEWDDDCYGCSRRDECKWSDAHWPLEPRDSMPEGYCSSWYGDDGNERLGSEVRASVFAALLTVFLHKEKLA